MNIFYLILYNKIFIPSFRIQSLLAFQKEKKVCLAKHWQSFCASTKSFSEEFNVLKKQ